MFTAEFEFARYLPPEALKNWLREKRKGVKFYPEVVTRQFPSGPQKAEVLRTSKRVLCVNPTAVGPGGFAVGQPYGYTVGHITSGKQFSTWVFPSAQTVKALVVALEDCGVDLTDPGSLPRPLINDLHQFIHQVYMELHRFPVDTTSNNG